MAISTTGGITTAPGRLDDIGLLVIRLGVGAMMLHFGLQKFLAFGSTNEEMRTDGWRAPAFATLLNAGAEVGGAVALLFGVLTPFAAAAILGVMLDAWAVNVAHTAFWSDPFSLPFVLGFAALGLLLKGAGAYSVDARLMHRKRWPAAIIVAALVIAVVAGMLTWVVLNGVNPIHLTSPKG